MRTQKDRIAFRTGEPDGSRPRIKLMRPDDIEANFGIQSQTGDVAITAGGTTPGTQLVASLGETGNPEADDYRQAGGLLGRWLIDHSVAAVDLLPADNPELSEPTHLGAFIEGLILGSFSFTQFKSSILENVTEVYMPADGNEARGSAVKHARLVSGAVNYARSIAQQPPNAINPSTLADEAAALAEARSLTITRFTAADLLAMKAGAITAVGQGSKTPSELIILEHTGNGPDASQPPIVVVGKAITFDTGGYTLKKLYGMASMKYDKCGGAAVLGIMKGVTEVNASRRVIGIIAAAENMVSGDAYRPNDIITSLSGKTIEIISTDAEGRLVLADALTYACREYKPGALIDLATLTSGVTTALGKVRAGLFSTDQRLADSLFESGERTHERLWQLPLDEDYFELIRGKDSDLVNSYHHPAGVIVPASSIMGAMFLRQFIEGPFPWAHIDIAATATTKTNLPYAPRGATGFGVRLILDFIENYQ